MRRLIWHRRDLRLTDNPLYVQVESIPSVSLYVFDESQVISDTIYNDNGCISNVLIFDVIVSPTQYLDEVVTICEGESYEGYDSTGVYVIESFDEISGCPVIITLDLSVSETSFSNVDFFVCEGDSISINGQTYIFFESEELSDTTVNAIGCIDQITTYSILVNPIEHIAIDTTICEGDSLILEVPFVDSVNYQWSTGDTVSQIVVKDEGEYIVTGISPSCIISDTIQVFTYPLPNVLITGLDVPFCLTEPLDTFQLASNFSGGIFSGDQIIEDSLLNDSIAFFVPTDPGSYFINFHYTDINGCINNFEEEVNVFDLPTVDLGSDTFLLSGMILTLSGGGNDNYEYLWSTGSSTSFLEVVNPGYYALTISDTITGCMNSDTILIDLASKNENILLQSSWSNS